MTVKDMVGQKYGHLKVLARSKHKDSHGSAFWVCQCDCGAYLQVRGDNLRSGRTVWCSRCNPAGGRPSRFIKWGGKNGLV